MRSISALVLGILLGLSIATAPTLRDRLAEPDSTSTPIELFVDDPARVAAGVQAGESVAVSVSNLSNRDLRFAWSLTIPTAPGRFGEFTLRPFESHREVLVMPSPAAKSWASFSLEGFPEKLRWEVIPTSSVTTPAPAPTPEPVTPEIITPEIITPEAPTPTTVPTPSQPPTKPTPITPKPTPPAPTTPAPKPTDSITDPAPLSLDTVTATVYFAPQSAILTAEAQSIITELAAFLDSALDMEVACDGYTQFGSSHGADVRLSTRRAEAVCASLADLLDGTFTATGHGRAQSPVNASRQVRITVSYRSPEPEPSGLSGTTII